MSEPGAYEPPPWPRFLFKHGEQPRQFNSQEEADAEGPGWKMTQAEADAAATPARGVAPTEGESDTPSSRRR